jgi:putative DNA primase/helicase
MTANVIESFKSAIYDSLGYVPEHIQADGMLHRIKDNDGKMNGAYVLHLDNRPGGYFQCFKQGIKQTWKMTGNFIPLSNYQRQVFRSQCQKESEQRQKDEIAKNKVAAERSIYIWNKAPIAPANHPYLINKHIGIHGARLGRDNTLIIPLYNTNKDIINLQFISETGGKRFLSGGQKKGCFYILEGVKDKIIICEGFATAASLYENSGYLTVVAFDAGNLKNVALNIKSLYPASKIVVAGDNDLSGIGQKKALEAALAVNGQYLVPATVGHDWNDSLTVEVTHA